MIVMILIHIILNLAYGNLKKNIISVARGNVAPVDHGYSLIKPIDLFDSINKNILSDNDYMNNANDNNDLLIHMGNNIKTKSNNDDILVMIIIILTLL